MSGLVKSRGVGRVGMAALVAATLTLGVGASQAAPGGGHGIGHGGHGYGGGGDQRYRDRSGSQSHRGRASIGGGARTRDVHGGRDFSGGARYKGGSRDHGGARYNGGARHDGGPRYKGGQSYSGRARYSRGVRTYHGGGRHYTRSYGYYHRRPRSFVSFGIALGVPYYCPRAYRTYVEPYPIEVEAGSSIDVTNEPPAGCEYFDRFCDRHFANLDDYTDHVDNEGHAKTIEIVDEDSGDTIRSLEFVGGYWSVTH